MLNMSICGGNVDKFAYLEFFISSMLLVQFQLYYSYCLKIMYVRCKNVDKQMDKL